MLIWLIRAVFVLASSGVGYHVARTAQWDVFRGLIVGLMVALVMIVVEMGFSKTPISSISSIVFGVLIGLLFATLFYRAILLVFGEEANWLLGSQLVPDPRNPQSGIRVPLVTLDEFKQLLELTLVSLFCYLGIAVLYQTRDSFNFIIPYVEFKKQERGIRPVILDTSVIIDGRIADICETRIVDSPIVVPRFVLEELQHIADSADRLKRNRGRRGLDMLNRLQRMESVEIQLREASPGKGPVDARLVQMAKATDGRIVTNDFNLNKIAQLQGVEVININDLANALKPVALPGEDIKIRLIRPGEEAGQGVGYLDDGTMVVAEQGRDKIGQTVAITVTSVLQTSAGRMIFGKIQR